MPRIQDIGAFNAVREAGLAKLTPSIPRITVGMGTCGRGNGAEEVFHALNEAIQRSGLDVLLASVGCFGPCFQEPIVSIRLPGNPIVMLHRVHANDAARILEGISSATFPSDLVYAKIEEWDHITAHVRYGQGFPEIPLWNALPFFKGQKKIVLRNCGLISPSDIEESIAVGGYQALYQVLIDGRTDAVIEQVKASRLRGRGGAGFLTGNKWDFLAKAKADAKYIICNADEGDPGAYMNRNEIEGDPHSMLEGMIIGAFVTGATDGIVYVRAEYPLAVRRLNRAIEQAREYGLLGTNILDRGFNFDIELVQGAGAFVCGEETALIASLEGFRRPPAPAPAVSRAKRPLGKAHQHQQRRNLVQHCAYRRARSRLVCRDRQRQEPRHKSLLAGGQGAKHRSDRNAAGHAAAELHLRHWRRRRTRPPRESGANRRTLRRLRSRGDV